MCVKRDVLWIDEMVEHSKMRTDRKMKEIGKTKNGMGVIVEGVLVLGGSSR